MTVEHWLARRPPPPDALGTRLRELLGEASSPPGDPAADRLVEAAERVLERLLREGCATRQSALDLLVADAMATYAFEAAAEEPERIVARTDRAMARIAALAGMRVGGGNEQPAPDPPR